jgi:hypothetical protein
MSLIVVEPESDEEVRLAQAATSAANNAAFMKNLEDCGRALHLIGATKEARSSGETHSGIRPDFAKYYLEVVLPDVWQRVSGFTITEENRVYELLGNAAIAG